MSPWPVMKTIGIGLASFGQALLQLEAVEPRHRHVEHEAAFDAILPPGEIRFRRFERLDFQSLFAQDTRERLANTRIVVDQEYRVVGGGHLHSKRDSRAPA